MSLVGKWLANGCISKVKSCNHTCWWHNGTQYILQLLGWLPTCNSLHMGAFLFIPGRNFNPLIAPTSGDSYST